ncbi:MAG: hypothetical protein NT027_14145 [Proteobacteria bacterium]|nr:hypothetical protein [Pseudomonadota bacterium]
MKMPHLFLWVLIATLLFVSQQVFAIQSMIQQAQNGAVFEKVASIKSHGGSLVTSTVVDREIVYSGDRNGVVVATSFIGVKELWVVPVVASTQASRSVTAMAVSMDGVLLAVATECGDLMILDAKSGRVLRRNMPVNGLVMTSMSISSDDSMIAAGDQSGTLMLWTSDLTEYQVMGIHDWSINDVRFVSERYLLVADSKSVKIWDVENFGVNRVIVDRDEFGGDGLWISELGYSNSLDFFVVTSNTQMIVFDIRAGNVLARFRSPNDQPLMHSQIIDSDTKVIATDRSGAVLTWDIATGQFLGAMNAFSMSAVSGLRPIKGSYFLLTGLKLDVFGSIFLPVIEIWQLGNSTLEGVSDDRSSY